MSKLEDFYATFEAMEKHDMGKELPFPARQKKDELTIPVLNLHGEVLEALAPADTSLEEAFLPTLKTLHERFPKLRIIVGFTGLDEERRR